MDCVQMGNGRQVFFSFDSGVIPSLKWNRLSQAPLKYCFVRLILLRLRENLDASCWYGWLALSVDTSQEQPQIERPPPPQLRMSKAWRLMLGAYSLGLVRTLGRSVVYKSFGLLSGGCRNCGSNSNRVNLGTLLYVAIPLLPRQQSDVWMW